MSKVINVLSEPGVVELIQEKLIKDKVIFVYCNELDKVEIAKVLFDIGTCSVYDYNDIMVIIDGTTSSMNYALFQWKKGRKELLDERFMSAQKMNTGEQMFVLIHALQEKDEQIVERTDREHFVLVSPTFLFELSCE